MIAAQGGALVAPQAPQLGAGLSATVQVEMQRTLAQLQVQALLARSNPRDEARCEQAVLRDCELSTVAESAQYDFAVGGNEVKGPTIRMAETVARRWGNLACGIKELGRSEGYSECLAYAMDLETGFYDERVYQVRHWRDTRSGGYPLKDEREIYELIANLGQRRKRALLLTILPPHLVAKAMHKCLQISAAKANCTPEGVAELLAELAEVGVVREQVEAVLQRRVEAMQPSQYLRLRRILQNLRDGLGTVADYFKEAAPAPEGVKGGPPAARAAVTATQAAKERVQTARKQRQAAEEKPDPFAEPPPASASAQVATSVADGAPVFTLGQLRAALVEAPDREEAALVMDRARALSEEEQQALGILYAQRFPDEG